MKKIFAFQKDKNRLKLLLLDIDKKKIFIKDYKEHEIGGENRDKTIELIKGFVSNNKALSSRTVCFLPLSSIYIRKITFPYRRISQVRKSIRFAVEPHIPIPIENTKIFFHPIHAKNNKLEVMVFIIPQAILNEQLDLINSLQLFCNEIYLAPLSLFNFFISNTLIKENTLWLYVGENSTYVFYILKNKQLVDLREILIGKKNITQEKGELKREISTVLLSIGSESFESNITEIHISGLSTPAKVGVQSDSSEIFDWLAKNFNIPVKPVEFNELLSVELPARSEVTSGAGGKDSNFIPEILYAIYGRSGSLSINFYPPVLQEKEKKGIRISCFIAVFALLILSFRLQFERIIYERRFNALNHRIEKILLETFPETKDMRTPLLQMKSRVQGLKDSVIQSKSNVLSPLEAFREISQVIDKNLQIKLDSFRLKDDNVVISGNTLSYQDIDKMKEAIGKSPLFSSVDIESAQTTDKGVTFRLKISPARSDVKPVGKPSAK